MEDRERRYLEGLRMAGEKMVIVIVQGRGMGK